MDEITVVKGFEDPFCFSVFWKHQKCGFCTYLRVCQTENTHQHTCWWACQVSLLSPGLWRSGEHQCEVPTPAHPCSKSHLKACSKRELSEGYLCKAWIGNLNLKHTLCLRKLVLRFELFIVVIGDLNTAFKFFHVAFRYQLKEDPSSPEVFIDCSFCFLNLKSPFFLLGPHSRKSCPQSCCHLK